MDRVRPGPRGGWALALAPTVVLGILAAAGCVVEERSVGYGGIQVGDEDGAASRGGRGSAVGGGLFGLGGDDADSGGAQWAIALGQFEGPDRYQRAQQAARQLTAAAPFADVWVSEEGGRAMLYHGRYGGPEDRRAQADLERWRQMARSGQVRPGLLMMAPIPPQAPNAYPQYDLRRVWERHDPAREDLFTLQVGFFDEAYGAEFRRAAEERAAALRQEGREAHYYHGSNRSMVTVGLFGEEAVRQTRIRDGGAPVYGPAIEALRRRFPHNRANGKVLRIEDSEGNLTEQPSVLVRVPKP